MPFIAEGIKKILQRKKQLLVSFTTWRYVIHELGLGDKRN